MATSKQAPKTFFAQHPALIWILITVLFLGAGSYTTYVSGGYLTPLWRIAECTWRPPAENLVMVECDVFTTLYRQGIMFLDIEPRLTNSLRKADVIVTGNSRTIEAFAIFPKDNQLEVYFRKKGLKFFILAEDGSGFRYRKMLLDQLEVRPRIGLINTEDLSMDMFEDSNREIFFAPDRFWLPFKVIHFAIELQKYICTSDIQGYVMDHLKKFYCNGTRKTFWRNVDTGTYLLPDKERLPTARMSIIESADTRIGNIDLFRRRMNVMNTSYAWQKNCILFYLVPSPSSSLEVARVLAKETNRPFVFAPIGKEKNYFVYDSSHMEVDTALRWTEEFIQILDPQIDKCLEETKDMKR